TATPSTASSAPSHAWRPGASTAGAPSSGTGPRSTAASIAAPTARASRRTPTRSWTGFPPPDRSGRESAVLPAEPQPDERQVRGAGAVQRYGAMLELCERRERGLAEEVVGHACAQPGVERNPGAVASGHVPGPVEPAHVRHPVDGDRDVPAPRPLDAGAGERGLDPEQ